MKTKDSKQKFPWLLLNVFIGIVIAIAVLGYIYFKSIDGQFKRDEKNHVSSIAELKVKQIAQWLNEREGDAKVLSGNLLTQEAVSDYLTTGRGKAKLLDIIQLYIWNYDYITIYLIDDKGKVRLSYGDNKDSLSEIDADMVKHLLAEPSIKFSELHISVFTGDVTYDLLVPLIEKKSGSSRVLGLFLMRIDPYRILYPLVQSWPTDSKTGETLLLKRDEGDIIFLNELRHQNNTALKLRLPLNNAEAIYYKAAQGIEGAFEGIDYRGVPVLAAIKKVPGTSWIMVSKIDQEEIEQPLRQQAAAVWFIAILLIAVSGISIGIYWRHQRANYYEQLYKLEIEKQTLEKHFDHIVKYANDIIILFDDSLNIIEVNDKACTTYGYSREEFTTMNAFDLRPVRLKVELKGIFDEYEDGKGLIYETIHVRKDGVEFPIEVSGRLFKIDIGKYYQTIIRDISERKTTEKKLYELNANFRSLFENSLYGVAVANTSLKFVQVNDALCNLIGYSREDLLEGMGIGNITHPEDVSPSKEMMGKLIRKETPNFVLEKRYLTKAGKRIDAITYVQGVLGNDGEISACIASIMNITDRKKSEEALRELSLRNEALLASVPDIIMEVDNNKIYTWANRTGHEFFGEDVIGRSADYYFEGEQKIYEMVQPLFMGDENIIYIESWQRRYDGEKRLLAWWCRVLKDEDGKVTGALSTARDITDQKAIEEKFKTLYEAMTEGVALHEVLYDEKGKPIDYRIEDINPAFEKHIGIPVEKAKGALASELYGVSPAPFLNEYAEVTRSGKPYAFQTYFPPLEKHFEISCFSPQQGKFATVFSDITEKKRMEEALERRIISLTNPIGNTEDLKFEDLFNLDEIQNIQDAFAKATGVASIITDIEGNPITKPSQFCDLCLNVIRKTEKGLANCIHSDAVLGKTTLSGPNVQHCLSGGLWDGGASVKAGEKHLANWLIGQIYDDSTDKEVMLNYAHEIGADEEEFSLALEKVTRMPKEQFQNICDSLYLFAQKLSDMALQNVQQARFITRQKIADEEIRTLNRELEQRVVQRTAQLEASNKELEAFSYSVSHDLRSPLRALDGFARILKEDYTTVLDEEGNRLLNVIIDNSKTMGNLIDDLLAFSRLSRQEMKFSPINMYEMAQSVITELTQSNENKKASIKLDQIPDAYGDTSMIRQVWINLISNALKFSSKSHNPMIEIGFSSNEAETTFFVRDNGIGFDMQYSNKLFGVFQRLHSVKDFEGTGVGLALVQRIINRMNGQVWGEGKINEGAIFYFTLKNTGE